MGVWCGPVADKNKKSVDKRALHDYITRNFEVETRSFPR